MESRRVQRIFLKGMFIFSIHSFLLSQPLLPSSSLSPKSSPFLPSLSLPSFLLLVATPLPSGNSRGLTLRSALSSLLHRTTAKCLSGRRREEQPWELLLQSQQPTDQQEQEELRRTLERGRSGRSSRSIICMRLVVSFNEREGEEGGRREESWS